MSSSQPDSRGGSVGARLTAWYCGFFVVSLLALFCAVYLTMASSLRKTDAEIIRTKLTEMNQEYKEAGLAELRKAALNKRTTSFFIRVSDNKNRTLFVNLPDSEDFGPEMLAAVEKANPDEDRWLFIPTQRHGVLEVANSKTNDNKFLQVGRSTQHRDAFLSHFRKVCAVIIFPVIFLALAGGAFLAQRALAPIRQLNAAVHAIIATGKMDARIPPRKTAGELRELVISFNQMLERIDALIQGMRSVLDNVAHDLRTPLTRLRGIAEMALQNPADTKSAHEALADCIEESERVLTMLNTLMDISEAETGAMRLELKKVPVSVIAAEVAELYREVAEEKKITLSVEASAELMATADENRLRQAIANLVDNALKYTPDGGAVRIEIARQSGSIVLSVRDSGIGIPLEEIPHVWDRLYRGDKSRSQRGLGLGLSLVKAIAQAHAGRCEVESTPGAGSLFRLHLPAAA